MAWLSCPQLLPHVSACVPRKTPVSAKSPPMPVHTGVWNAAHWQLPGNERSLRRTVENTRGAYVERGIGLFCSTCLATTHVCASCRQTQVNPGSACVMLTNTNGMRDCTLPHPITGLHSVVLSTRNVPGLTQQEGVRFYRCCLGCSTHREVAAHTER
jgi:hypothetical protein